MEAQREQRLPRLLPKQSLPSIHCSAQLTKLPTTQVEQERGCTLVYLRETGKALWGRSLAGA